MMNEYLIQTMTSTYRHDTHSSMAVNKTQIDAQTYAITMRSWCNNMFGCVPEAVVLKGGRFNLFVLDQEPQPNQQGGN